MSCILRLLRSPLDPTDEEAGWIAAPFFRRAYETANPTISVAGRATATTIAVVLNADFGSFVSLRTVRGVYGLRG